MDNCTQPSDSLNNTLRRNIEVLRERRKEDLRSASLQDRVAHRITAFGGSMAFVYVHLGLYGFWILANLELVPGTKPWDPTFVVLAMIASVEAIFLSTFILITQNRMAAAAERRAELDLQVGLLAEQEVTKLVQMVSEIAARVGVPDAGGEELEEMKRAVAPEAVLDAIEKSQKDAAV